MVKMREWFLVLTLIQLVCCGPTGVFNVTIKSDQDLLNFPSINQNAVLLLDSEIPILTSKLLLQMSSVQKLFIYGGSVPVAQIGGNFHKMVLFKSNTEKLVIVSAINYDLQTLIVAHGKLRKVPSNLSALSKLEKMGLIGNEIETISMEQFTGLVNLRKLSLFGNRIKQVYSDLSEPTNLPSLEVFALNDNQLSQLDLCHLKAPSLQILQLHNNRLSLVDGLLEAFPALEKVSLRENPLNCQWKERILNELNWRRVDLYDRELVTCDDGVEKDEVKESLQKLDLKLDQILEQIIKLQYDLEQEDQSEGSEEAETEEEHAANMYDELLINDEISYF